MLSKVKSFGLSGLEGFTVDVEVDVTSGLPSYDIVGLGDTAIKESKERVRSAIRNSKYQFPIDKITINLAPADRKKEGSLYDVAIAVGVMTSVGEFTEEQADKFAYIGELSLDGSLKKVNGVLPLLITARNLGVKNIVVPYENRNEASYLSNINVYAIKNLVELHDFLLNNLMIEKVQTKEFKSINYLEQGNDFKFIKGQESAKRALEIAAAGGHNVIMIGPPGTGKSMLAKAFPTIMPDLTFEEALEITKIHSIAGELDMNDGIVKSRPFRSPHHTSTIVSLVGGGRNAKPGEISLAHNGVLFLDEFPEYSRQTIETLRQPLEDGKITVARNALTVEYPASFTLIASMNPCPCGYRGSKDIECKCTSSQIHKYMSKLSGPIMDRIDLHVEVDGITYKDISGEINEEPSSEIKKRVDIARKIQLNRFKGTNIFCNAHMNNEQVRKYCILDEDSKKLVELAFDKFKLSARAYNRILKVARTIADLDCSENIKSSHIAQAIQYRVLDKKYVS
jgi:magnesium chelatase family protein